MLDLKLQRHAKHVNINNNRNNKHCTYAHRHTYVDTYTHRDMQTDGQANIHKDKSSMQTMTTKQGANTPLQGAVLWV